MEISVIIPCYNAAATLEVQLEALARQFWTGAWEVILSDNGSTDESVKIAQQWESSLPAFRIIDSSDIKGPAHARNRGAASARGKSLLFCDADDAVADGWLGAMANALETHDFVTSRFESSRLNPSWAVKTRGCPQQDGVQTYNYPPFLPHAASAGIGVKRWVHETVGGFDETMPMLEDTDYCWRIQLMGIPLVFVHDALIHYRLRSTVRGMLRQAMLWGEYNVYLYQKYRAHGMPALSRKVGIKRVLKLFRMMPYCLFDAERRLRWIRDIAWQWGRIQGSVRYRIFAL